MKHKQFLLLVSVLTNLILFIMLYYFLGFYFETNDDKYITEILTGTFSQGPEAHTVFVNYLLSLVWAWLYRMVSFVPWYGGSLILFEWAACTCINYAILKTADSWAGAVARHAGYLCFFFSSLYILTNVQFTMVAALLATAGYVYLLTGYRERKTIVVFFLLELFALLIRGEAMLMIQPLGLCCMAGCLWMWKRAPEGKWELKLLRNTGAALLLCLVIAVNGRYNRVRWKGMEGV